jgi:hypothetical protein
MEPVDVSIHGWPLGPVPIIASIYSAMVYFRILSGKTKINSSNTICPFAVSSIIIVMGAAFLGVRERDDLSGSVILAAGAAGTVVSIILSALIHRKAGIPILREWILYDSLPTKRILTGLLGIGIMLLVFFGLDALLSEAISDQKCNTGKCVNAAITFGSNLYAAGPLWLTTWLFSLLGMMGALHGRELLRRIFR